MRITPFYDRTDLIEACIDTVSHAIFEGIVLIVAILFLILWDFRAAIIVALLLPLTAAATFILMGWQGVTANLMSLGGLSIAIGIVVDGAVVITENISRHMRERANSEASRDGNRLRCPEGSRPAGHVRDDHHHHRRAAAVLAGVYRRQDVQTAGRHHVLCAGGLAGHFADGRAGVVRGDDQNARPRPSAGNPLVRAIQWLYMPVLRLSMRGRWISIAIAARVHRRGVLGPAEDRHGSSCRRWKEEGAIAINVVRLPTASVEGSALQATEIEKRLLASFPRSPRSFPRPAARRSRRTRWGRSRATCSSCSSRAKSGRAGVTKAKLVEGINEELAAIPGIRPAFSSRSPCA